MPASKFTHHDAPDFPSSVVREETIEYGFIGSAQKLMILRPYQVYAVKHMVTCIDDDNGNGYIWHTTGSGKTLTSFNASSSLRSKRSKVAIKGKTDHRYS